MTNPKIPDPLPKELPAGTRWRGNRGHEYEHEWELLKPAVLRDNGKYYASDYLRTRRSCKPDPQRVAYRDQRNVFFSPYDVEWDTYVAVPVVRVATKIEIGEPIKATKQYSYDPYANYMRYNPDHEVYRIMVLEGRTKPEQPRVSSNHPSTWPEESGDELYCS